MPPLPEDLAIQVDEINALGAILPEKEFFFLGCEDLAEHIRGDLTLLYSLEAPPERPLELQVGKGTLCLMKFHL